MTITLSTTTVTAEYIRDVRQLTRAEWTLLTLITCAEKEESIYTSISDLDIITCVKEFIICGYVQSCNPNDYSITIKPDDKVVLPYYNKPNSKHKTRIIDKYPELEINILPSIDEDAVEVFIFNGEELITVSSFDIECLYNNDIIAL